MLAGVILGGLVLASMTWVSTHGGIYWFGGMFVAASLILRGVARLSAGSGTAATATAAHDWIGAPRDRAAMTRISPGVAVLVVLGCLGLVAGLGWAASATSGPTAPPYAGGRAAPAVANPAAPVADSGPWYPSGYKAVGTDGAYEPRGYPQNGCRPGTSCGRASVMSRTACRALVVRVAFFDDPSAVVARATYTVRKVKAASGRLILVSTTKPVSSYRIVSMRCDR